MNLWLKGSVTLTKSRQKKNNKTELLEYLTLSLLHNNLLYTKEKSFIISQFL